MRMLGVGVGMLVGVAAAGFFSSPAQAATVYVPCGASIGGAIAANPSGTVFQLAGNAATPCTYWAQTFKARNYATIQGDCSSGTGANTIIDGAGAAMLTDGYGYGIAGVTIQCVTIQHYAGGQLNLFNRWLLRNCTLQYSGGEGVVAFGSSTVRNCRVTSNYLSGIRGDQRGVGGDGGTMRIIGNEVTNNNTGGSITSWAAGIKILGRPDLSGPLQDVAVLDNYVHDNLSEGIWSDIKANNLTIGGNTIIHNRAEGIRCEITNVADIADNVVNNNDYGGNPSYWGNIYLSNCASVNVHDNNVLVAAGYGGGIAMETQCRSDAPAAPINNAFYRNTVTFLGTGGLYTRRGNEGWDDETKLGGNCPSDPSATSLTSNAAFSNTFYSPAVTDAHFDWGIGGGFFILSNLAAVQSGYGVELGSTIAVGNGGVAGCTQVGCTGSGWPH